MPETVDRRSVLARIGAVLAGVLSAAVAAPALIYLLDPLRRRSAQAGPAVPVAPLAEVPDLDAGRAAPPLRAAVVARELRDAWSRLPRVKLGAVWLFRRGADLTCLSARCPHAGCAIDYDERRGDFHCPCHDSRFSLDGRRLSGPSPRDMDRLDVEVRDGRVLCHYRRFRLATSAKEPA